MRSNSGELKELKVMKEREDNRVEAIKEVAEELLRKLVQGLEERLPNDPKLEMTVKIELNLDWPYELAVELSASSSVYSRRDVEKAVTEVLDEELKRAEDMLKNKGLRPLP